MAINDPPLSSKKFIGFIVAEITWKAIIILCICFFRADLPAVSVYAWWFLFTSAIIAGFIETGYIIGQFALDKYIHTAEIAANVTKQPKN